MALDNYLDSIDIPFEAVNCNIFHNCTVHYDEFYVFYNDIISACVLATDETIPHNRPTSQRKGNEVPGWNSHVREKRDEAIFWHTSWVNLGRPSTGWVAQMRRTTRADYHRAIKYVKKNRNNLVKNQVTKSLSENNPNKFWHNINKIKKNKVSPKIIDSKTGIEACNVVKDNYNNLYNHHKNTDMTDIRHRVNSNIECKCAHNDGNNKHLHNVNIKHVADAIKKVKNGQYDYSTELISESILHGPQKLTVILSLLYTIMVKHGFSCDALNNVVIKPIIKDKRKPNNDSNNYRAVAPYGTLAKILDYIIIDVFKDDLETSEYQFAYKSSYFTTLCSLMVVETLQYYRSKGSNVFVSLLDYSKAFDLVKYDKLFKMLL